MLVITSATLALACQALKPPPEPVRPVERATVANVAAGDGAFAFRLWRVLRERSGNLAFSPVGVRVALTMVWAGAEGETADELGKVAGLSGDPTAIHQSNAALLSTWTKPPLGGRTAQLRVAHGFFAQAERQPVQPFVELLQRYYGAPFAPKDFTAKETVRDQINRWAEQRAGVTELVPSGGVDTGLELVLVSALQVRTEWAEPFEPRQSAPGGFASAAGKTRPVTMMVRTGEHKVAETDDARVVELDLTGDLCLDVFVPKGDLGKLEAALDERKLDQWLSALSRREATVRLPRFALGETLELGSALQKIGVHAAFAPGRADLSGMTGTRALHVSKAVHHLSFGIDEQGTGADAAELAAPTDAKGKQKPAATAAPTGVVVDATRPFVFMLRDRKRDIALGMGRVADPGSTGARGPI